MISRKPWQADAVLALSSAILFSMALGMMLNGLAGRFFKGLSPEDAQLLQFVVGVLSFQGAVLVLAGFFLQFHQLTWAEAFGLRNATWLRVTLLSVSTGVIILIVGLELGWLSGEVMSRCGLKPEAQEAVQVLQQAMSPGRRLIYGVAALGMAPIAEEVLFRGLLYPTIKQMGHPRLALWGTSLLFAGIHMNLMALVPLTFVAMMFAWLYEATDNLLAPIVAHCFFNAANFILLMNQDWSNYFQR
jgi:membrane protease YdiL (CAAX protease family)